MFYWLTSAPGAETETEIEVPVTEKGKIDYKAVRDKMRPIMEKAQKHVGQLVTQYQRYKEKK